MTYRIITTTDPYNANRYPGFKFNNDHTKAHRLEEHNLTLEEARKELARLMSRAEETRGLDSKCEDYFISDIFKTYIEEENGNYNTLVTAADFDNREMEAELERIAKQGMEAYDEDGIRLEETWYILDEWRADREVSINGEWYTRESFIEATLIYREI